MHVLEAIRRQTPSLSFEFFPPRDPAGVARLTSQARRLERLSPDFVSVTYGAGGSGPLGRLGRDGSVSATGMLRQVTQAARVAHLTLVGQRREDLVEAVQALLAVGAEAFMVLRGDPPGGPGGDWVSTPGGLTYAVELVELVRQLSSAPVGVAAFPYGHPTAPSLRHDAAVLAGKQEAGADFAISQVVFDAAAYFGLRDRSELAGATLPIIPGIMPVSQVTRVDRLELYSGAPVPAPLLGLIERASSGEELDQVGIAWSVKLVQELLRGGAPGVHFYTLNSCPAAEAICRELGLTGRKSR